MKFSCTQQTLSKALNTVSKAVSIKTTIPILKGILLTADDGILKLSASNLDISIEKTVDADVADPGSIVVSARLFTDIVRKLPNEVITFEVMENGNVNIKTLNSEFNIYGQPAEDFPGTGEMKEVKEQLSFDKGIFSEMIRKTHFCASIDESRGIIVGVLIELKDGYLNMVSLDGFRLALAREKMEHENGSSIVIPARYLSEINKILAESENEEDIIITISDKKAVILLEKTKITVMLLAGKFIKYEDIIPKEFKTEVIADKEALLGSVERASLLAREGKNKLIKITVKENIMHITSASEEGAVKEDIIMEKSGDDLEIGFNSSYVLDALKAVTDDTVKLSFNNAVSPCVIRPVEGDEYEYLILPVRIPSA